MNWLLLHDLLQAQKLEFPHADVRPFAKEIRAAKTWPKIERLMKRAEASSRSRVENAIAGFILRRTWPGNLSAKDKMWISNRLRLATNLTMRLAVKLSRSNQMMPLPSDEQEVLFWLLVIQWDCFGMIDLISELKYTFDKVRPLPAGAPPTQRGYESPLGGWRN